MDKDEKFNWSVEQPGIMIRKGGFYRNQAGGGIKMAFKVDRVDYLLSGEAGRNFEDLSDQIIRDQLGKMHSGEKWECLLYEWNGVEFEQVNPESQDWFVC